MLTLGEKEKKAAMKKDLIQLVTFYLSGNVFAFDVSVVREIVAVLPLSPIPNSPRYCLGLCSVRNEYIPIFDLEVKFDLKISQEHQEEAKRESNVDARGYLILTPPGQHTFGIAIDRILRVFSLKRTEVVRPSLSLMGSLSLEYIAGVVKNSDYGIENGEITVLSSESLLDYAELDAIFEQFHINGSKSEME